MTEVTEQVRTTFASVARDVPVPVFDELAFRAQVRRSRRRRAGRWTGGALAAAGVAAAAVLVVPGALDTGDGAGRADDGTGVVAQPGPPVQPDVLPQPLYFTAGMQLVAVTPDGQVEDLGRYEAVVGSTAEGVLAVGTDSVPVWIGSRSSGEGDGSFTFEPGAGPVVLPESGPVQSVALSGDGRWLAWLDLADAVVVHDLKAREMVSVVEVSRNSYVSSVSDRGVLVSQNGNLSLLGQAFDLGVPTERDGYGWLSDTAGDLVSVVDRDDVTRIYDIGSERPDGTAPLVDSVPGTGRLAPYAGGIVSVEGSTVTRYLLDGEPETLTGIEGRPQSVGWLDEDHALVTSTESGGTSVYLCPVAETMCTRVAFSEDDVRLAE